MREIDLPEGPAAQFGASDFTALNGDMLHITAEPEAELITALRERGIEVTATMS